MITKYIKSSLFLSAAVLFSGLSFVSAEIAIPGKDAGAKQSLEVFANISGAQLTADLPAPIMLAADFDKAAPSGGGACTPSQALVPGTSFSPTIDDPVRFKAITDLLGKIAACKPLPYPHDGIINTNTEGGMPAAPKDFYKEYTLMVPGRNTGDPAEQISIGGKPYMTGPVLSARGPERIIIGGSKEIYYTMDHYKTFLHLTIVK